MKLFLVRGLPSAGKTTLAKELSWGVYSTDDYFTCPSTGKYEIDLTQLDKAHEWCQRRVDERMARINGNPTIAVANTFSERWELEPYLQMCKKHGWRAVVIDLYDGGLTDEELFERGLHDVPLHTIQNMRKRWEHDWKNGNPVPPWDRG